MKRAIIYTRISDARAALGLTAAELRALSKDERKLLYERGVTRQMGECDTLADRRGDVVVERFKENDLSAYKPNVVRPKFERTLEMIKNGEVDVIIVWHLDRYLRRNDQLERLILICEKHNVEIVGVTSGGLDLSTPTGRLFARQMVSFNAYESEHHAERRVLANTQRAEAGQWSTCNRPFGYTQNGEPHPIEAQYYRDAVEAIVNGQSIRGIATRWNKAGILTTRGNKWTGAQVRDVLERPRYAAILTHRGKEYPGTWQELVDIDKWRHMQLIIRNPARIQNRQSFEQKWLGAGLYRCGICAEELEGLDGKRGGRMRSEPAGARGKRAYTCRTKKHLHIQGEPVDLIVTAAVLSLFARRNAHLLIHSPANVDKLNERRNGIDGEMAQYKAARKKNKIPVADYLELVADLTDERNTIDAQLAAATRSTPAATAIDTARQARDDGDDVWLALERLWEGWTVTQRARAVDEVATVTLVPATKRNRFDPKRVRVKARQPLP